MEIKPNIYISNRSNIEKYPTEEFSYSPNVCYPEYPFGEEISPVKNDVYDMIRECFKNYGFDKKNYGSKYWNPLGDIINKNDTVLIKPNWVMNFNRVLQNQENLDCLVTHPSVVRAIVDYVYVALQNSGTIIVADAPMQECDLQNLFKNAGYLKLFDFWERHISNISIKDLRRYSSTFKKGVIIKKSVISDANYGIAVDLGERSAHCFEKVPESVRYKVSDYSCDETNEYHHNKKHAYEISSSVLKSDVIINIPKPKCHRLAGMTAGMKNLVGTVYEKSCLPHRKLGDSKHGGDSFKNKSFLKNIMQVCDEKKTFYFSHYKKRRANFWRLLEKVTYVLGSVESKDKVRVGGWYGNDTIWRTVVDLNYIMLYARADGILDDVQQRKMLTIGDMIVCGQKNGPISPIKKYLGMIMISESNVLFDTVMCSIMGFDKKKIRYISDPKALKLLGYCQESIEKCHVKIDEMIIPVGQFISKNEWIFEPHDMWKGHIERKK